MHFSDRNDAGRALALLLRDQQPSLDAACVVLGLARGGVPVAAEVATGLGAALDVFCVRKIGAPGHRELAMGAVASGGAVVRNETVIRRTGVTPAEFDRAVDAELAVLEQAEQTYRGHRSPLDLTDRTVVVVDDGLATGASARVAVQAVRLHKPARVVVAVPVGAPESLPRVGADAVCCVYAPPGFGAVSLYYRHFPQVSDAEVRRLLRS